MSSRHDLEFCRDQPSSLPRVLLKPKRSRLIPSPNHGDGSSEASTHVKGKETLYTFNLPRARLFSQLLVGLVDLPPTGGSHGLAVANQAATAVDRTLPTDFAPHIF